MSMRNCATCRTVLSQFTPLFICCDPQRPFCRRCRPFYCPSCKRTEWRQIREMMCLICKRKLNQDQAFKEEICGQHYCPRCVAHAFLPHFLSKDPPIIVQMRCGHYKDKLEVESFLQDYCINCGFKFRPNVDFQLQNGMKFCDYCFKHDDRRQFQEFFQLCLSCGLPVTFKEAQLCKDLPLCGQCSANQTLIEQSIVRSSPFHTSPTSALSDLQSEKMELIEEEEPSEQPSEELSIVSRFSAFEIQDIEQKKGKLASMRALSKNSVQIRVQNYQLPSVVKDPSVSLTKCYLCSSLLEEGGTLLNTTHSGNRICKMCYAQTFDKSYLTYTRYNNYTQPQQQRATSNHKHPATNNSNINNPMKLSMLPKGQPSQQETQLLSSLLKHTAPPKIDRKEAWENETAIRNPCDVCKTRPAMIIRADKQRLCVPCKNKHG